MPAHRKDGPTVTEPGSQCIMLPPKVKADLKKLKRDDEAYHEAVARIIYYYEFHRMRKV